MIGNDVVDLRLAAQQSNWRRKGFLEKVFSPVEQEIITTSNDPDVQVWLLWSMKEAAYKAHQRQFSLPRQLNWLQQQCEILHQEDERASGFVRINGAPYFTTSEITSEYIYTSAEAGKTRGAKNVIFEAPSPEARDHLFRKIFQHFRLDPQELKMEKDELGMPFFRGNNSFFFDRFSLSGHGRYSGYNLSLINCETSVKHS